MDSAKYFILIGSLLFIMAITPGLVKKLPITSSVIYLLFGILIGPHGINVLNLHYLEHTKLIEVISEITVITSLFTVGLKLRVPLQNSNWLLPISYATVSMVVTIALMSLIAHFGLGMGIGESILLGAIISPTDPVLASEVQLRDSHEKNLNKFILTTEGGINDGTAFPFIMLGLGILTGKDSAWILSEWILKDLLWAISGGFIVGITSGLLITKIANYVKVIRKSYYLEDFLAISSIALSYGIALQIGAYGFLAVFANALTIRQFELRKAIQKDKEMDYDLPENVLSFNEQLERIFEVVSVGLVGILTDLNTFSWKYFLVPLVIFLVIRPISVFLGSIFSTISGSEKVFLSWFGIRGIGSIYYLYYALNHAPALAANGELVSFTLWTIFFSIFLHGGSLRLLIRRNRKRKIRGPMLEA